jgi:hypothetical protein
MQKVLRSGDAISKIFEDTATECSEQRRGCHARSGPALLKAERLSRTLKRVELVVSIMPLFSKIQLESVANQGWRDVSTAARDIDRQIMFRLED